MDAFNEGMSNPLVVPQVGIGGGGGKEGRGEVHTDRCTTMIKALPGEALGCLDYFDNIL